MNDLNEDADGPSALHPPARTPFGGEVVDWRGTRQFADLQAAERCSSLCLGRPLTVVLTRNSRCYPDVPTPKGIIVTDTVVDDYAVVFVAGRMIEHGTVASMRARGRFAAGGFVHQQLDLGIH